MGVIKKDYELTTTIIIENLLIIKCNSCSGSCYCKPAQNLRKFRMDKYYKYILDIDNNDYIFFIEK